MWLGVLVGLTGFGTEFICSFFLSYPPGLWTWTKSKLRPELTRYCGKLIYLTLQTNLIGAVYYTLRVCAVTFGFAGLHQLLVRMFPLIFALGTFLTAAYYGLDHFNPEQVKARKQIAEEGYPAIHVLCHLEHVLALPVVVVDALTLSVGDGALHGLDNLVFVGGYIGFYLILVHVNMLATGEWPYPIIDAIEKSFGLLGRCSFFGVLTLILLGFSYMGTWLLLL